TAATCLVFQSGPFITLCLRIGGSWWSFEGFGLSVFSFQFSVFCVQFSVFSFQCSVFGVRPDRPLQTSQAPPWDRSSPFAAVLTQAPAVCSPASICSLQAAYWR
ncbi:MAG: hypothetical protein AB7I37_11355, partial [Pirellulales bacterium]